MKAALILGLAVLTVASTVSVTSVWDAIQFEPEPKVAFADHAVAEVTNAEGSSVPGCEETNECFIPYTVTIDAGGEVIWSNSDLAAHTVTSGVLTEGGPDGVFDSGLLSPGVDFSHKFEEAGEYPYFCLVHPWMAGLVIVQETMGGHDDEDPAITTANDTQQPQLMVAAYHKIFGELVLSFDEDVILIDGWQDNVTVGGVSVGERAKNRMVGESSLVWISVDYTQQQAIRDAQSHMVTIEARTFLDAAGNFNERIVVQAAITG